MKYSSLIIFFTVSTHYLSAQDSSFSQEIGYGSAGYRVPAGKTLLIHTAEGTDRKILINGGTYYSLTQNSNSFNSPIVAKSGSTVSVTSSGGFPSSSNITGMLKSENTSSSNDEKTSSNTLNIFPNPTTNYLSIEYGRIKINEIQIIATTGKPIRTFKLNFSRINISDIPNGIYFVKLFTDQTVITQKIVKY